ncbi:MAG: diguanylate cyclase [Alphaproteobacteria bacterium]|nr:diguanylate cyclase [Alphaproteobacteria bacterium]
MTEHPAPSIANTGIFATIPAKAVCRMMDASMDMMCVCVDGKIRHINKAGLEILRADGPQTVLGQSFQDLFGGDLAGAVDDVLAFLDGEADATPLRVKTLDGSLISLRLKVQALPDLGPGAYVVFGEDITRQVEQGETIKRSEARFRKLIDHALDFICVLQDGVITYVNQAGMKMLKAAYEDEVVGQPINEFLHHDYQGILDGDLREFAVAGELIPLHMHDISQNSIDVEVGITVLEDGVHPRFMLEARDITAQNRAVTALRTSIDTLEMRVEMRTRELQEEVQVRRTAEEKMRHMASHDGLTGLPNRALCMDRLDSAIHHAHRTGKKCALMFVDLDGFKPINDNLGHDMGDALLKEIAGRLTSNIRENDTAARFGGDEFVLVLSGLETVENVVPVAEKVLTVVRKPVALGDKTGQVGASIGIAVYPDHGETPEDLLKQADFAMYKVKGSGKNNFIIADGSAEMSAYDGGRDR